MSEQKTNALLLVDLQNDFVAGGALEVPDGDAVIEIANRLMPQYDLVVATQDWHPANHGSFAASHAGVNVGDLFSLSGLSQVAWPVHCVQETVGADFVDSLNTECIDEIIRKGTDSAVDSYSGFFDNGRRNSTGLAGFLHEKNVARVDVMGLATDYCVKFTALDAVSTGFETRLIVDGCRGVNLQSGDVDDAIKEMQAAGVTICAGAQTRE
jgi:nicotinamidase/pyrazinamidase